jgi:hypothetical protein
MPAVAPFRWNMANPHLAHRLGRPAPLRTPPTFREDLLACAAQILRTAGDADLVFVGRSPESLYDLLSGLLDETDWRERLSLLQLSLTRGTPGRLRREEPCALPQLWRYFESLGLTPPQVVRRARPVAFVDLVFAGRTFGNLLKLLRHWSGGHLPYWRPVRERLRFLCIVERGHVAFDPWAPRDSAWTAQVSHDAVRTVSIDTKLWRYLADEQPKTTESFGVWAWTRRRAYRPPRAELRLRAARTAGQLRRWGGWRRRELAEALQRPPRPEPWRQRLIDELWASA